MTVTQADHGGLEAGGQFQPALGPSENKPTEQNQGNPSASVVRAPLCDQMRNTWSSPLTAATSGKLVSVSSQPGGICEKLTSRMFLPGELSVQIGLPVALSRQTRLGASGAGTFT